VLRYHGGKWRLAPWILAHFPPHRVYVEPFGGAASVLMRKRRAYAEVYNDLDGEVVNVFRVLRDPEQAARLERAVRLTPFARAEFNLSYELAGDPVEDARRFLIRSHMGFGTAAMRATVDGGKQRTGFRGNTTRARTIPADDWAGLPDVVRQIARRMAGVVIEQRDAAEVISAHDGRETLYYIDPPYPHATRGNSSRWNYRHEMTDDAHRALAGVLRAVQGMVVLSSYPSSLYDELYADWERTQIAAMADGARSRTEVLWLNPAASASLHSSRAQGELLPPAVSAIHGNRTATATASGTPSINARPEMQRVDNDLRETDPCAL